MAVILNILSSFDDRGVARAQKKLAEFGSSARGFAGSTAADAIRAGSAMQKVGDKATAFGRNMTLGVSLPIAAGLGFATKAAIEEGKEMALLDKALRNNVGATDAQVASVERWITKTQNATGIADGELRPAFAALVAVTKDTGKAQDLMSTAMDIAAAKGKPVVTIAEALAKAQNGNIGILSRYGVATKDATGKTLTFDEIMQNAAKTFGGSAAKAADTTAGRLAILKAKLSDTSESLGTSLIPMVERGAEVIGGLAERFNGLSPGMQGLIIKGGLAAAAIGPLALGVGKLTHAAGTALKVGGNLAMAFGENAKAAPAYARGVAAAARGGASFAKGAAGVVTSIGRQSAAFVISTAKTIAHTAATVAAKGVQLGAAAASKAMAAAQWLVNAAMSANPIGIVVVAIAGLVAALVIAYRKSETFRRIVNAAWDGIKTAAVAVFGFLKAYFTGWIAAVKMIFSKISAVVSAVVGFFGRLKDGAVRALQRVVDWARSLPGKIKDAVGGLGRTLYSAGGDLLRGLWNGMQGMAGWLRDKFTGFFKSLVPGWAKDALGIESPSRVFAEIGRQTAAGLVVGMDASRGLVARSAAALAGAASGSAAMSFAYSGAGGARGGGLYVAPGAFVVNVSGSGLSAPELEGAVRRGTEPGLVALAREIGRR